MTLCYLAVVEATPSGYSAYVPDLPGCAATAPTLAEAWGSIREAIQFHLDGLRAEGLPVPPPRAAAQQLAVH